MAGLLAAGCGVIVNGEELGEDSSVDEDIAEYEQLSESLALRRVQALDEAALELRAGGSWLAWIAGPTLALRRYPDLLELELAAPGIGYRVSSSHVLTLEPADAGVVYRSFALPSAELVDEQPRPTPAGFALLGDVALALEADELWRWQIGLEPPASLGSLADAGVDLSEPSQLEAVIDDSRELLLIHAGGRLSVVELDGMIATELAELDALLGVDARGALVRRGDGLYLHEFDGATLRVDEAIAASGWSLNPTFSTIHEYTGDGATLADDRVIYIGSAGVFGYELDATGPAAITPILIEPRWDVGAGIPRIEYREPLLVGATVLVRGLIGPAGEIGETGPVFAAPLDP